MAGEVILNPGDLTTITTIRRRLRGQIHAK